MKNFLELATACSQFSEILTGISISDDTEKSVTLTLKGDRVLTYSVDSEDLGRFECLLAEIPYDGRLGIKNIRICSASETFTVTLPEKVTEEVVRVNGMRVNEWGRPAVTTTKGRVDWFRRNAFAGDLREGFFGSRTSSSLQDIVQRYNLPDHAQPSLEKALRMAANNNKYEDLKFLITHTSVNVNAQDSNPSSRRTALHWAAAKGHQDCYDLLISHGAKSDIPDAAGITAQSSKDSSTPRPQ